MAMAFAAVFCRTSYSKQKKRLDDIKDSAAYKAFPKEDKQSIEDGLTVVQKLIDSGLVMIIFGAFGLVGLVVGAVFSGLSTKDAKWQMPGLIGWIVGLVFILLGLIVWGAMTAEGTDADQVSCSDDKGKDRVCPMGHSSILALVGFLLAVIGTVLHAIPSK
ncbi:unnamed protein product [Vitrella brassicaformis CCMP3155]|uniref:Uncharacterized protein n=1 Tax=Vitrella brassicaformis (strain CCMP3155) TaxID=1169540 RepID=A0A0G4EC34_VITBC|nr:unnamed protein product [Vitrella brassicaformis CCMP3155]|eukprot:CEL93037.1 unnamed protein product [Vitrella brassicaformis CCMP3155]